MKRNSKWYWLTALTAMAIFSIFSTGNVQAWGPLAQTAIAQAAQGADGMPPTTASRYFILETTMPKVFEYTHQAYTQRSYDFTDIMADNVQGVTDYCQVLAWGASQTAEKTGDYVFLHNISNNTVDRWINELLCDSLLFTIESAYHNTAVAEVAVMPKLLSDSTVDYTTTFGGQAIGGSDAILAAHFQAHVLVGELAILDSEIFQNNAEAMINHQDWRMAMDQSVESVVEYVVNHTQPQSSGNWMLADASFYGSQLLGKIGSLLMATGNAGIANQNQFGVYSYRVCLSSDQVNQITLDYLYDASRNFGEHPLLRQMARALYDLMTEDAVTSGSGPVKSHHAFSPAE